MVGIIWRLFRIQDCRCYALFQLSASCLKSCLDNLLDKAQSNYLFYFC